MATPYIGEIRLVGFNFEPLGWAICDGRILPISQYDALFALIGTTYGGDGQITFALPDLRGRAVVHQGNGTVIGQLSGTENVTVTAAQLPVHNHNLPVQAAIGTLADATNNTLAQTSLSLGNVYDTASTGVGMNPSSIGLTGGSQPHNNMQPYLTVNYIIALEGIFPSQN